MGIESTILMKNDRRIIIMIGFSKRQMNFDK